MSFDDSWLISRKILVGAAITLIPLLILGGGLALTRSWLEAGGPGVAAQAPR